MTLLSVYLHDKQNILCMFKINLISDPHHKYTTTQNLEQYSILKTNIHFICIKIVINKTNTQLYTIEIIFSCLLMGKRRTLRNHINHIFAEKKYIS